MKCKIVGIQPQDYKLDNGYAFKGRIIHVIDCDTKSDGQVGQRVSQIKMSDEHKCSSVPLIIGNEYDVYFTQKGSLDELLSRPIQ